VRPVSWDTSPSWTAGTSAVAETGDASKRSSARARSSARSRTAGVREILARRLPPAISQGVIVTAGRLGDRAEVLGAVALATRSTSAYLLTP
jgi:hypothetical protein